ncbi:hypothetical protein [Bosea sp. TAF32]
MCKCLDVDIGMMLATNRLPIKTLNIEVAESMPISVAYGPLPP